VVGLDTTGRVTAVLRTLVTAAAVTLVLAGCSPKTSREDSTRVVRPSELVAVEGPAPTGRFYVKAGDNGLAADLYEFRFSPRGFDKITTEGRVSTLDGCSEKVILSAAQKEVGLTDHLQELKGNKLVPVDQLGLQPGSDPHVSADCRILYLRVAEADPELVNEIMLFNPGTGTTTSVVKGSTVGSASWGPDGEIIILMREATGPVLVVREPDGSQTQINPEQPDIGNVQWGRGGWIAMGVAEPRQAPTGTLFVNPATRERTQLDGWLPLAWSPDGKQLLVTDSKKGTTLAVVELPDLTKTRNVGVSEAGTVWDAVWLPPA
jgi:Gluconolactonase